MDVEEDECGVCDGGNADQDCNGDCFGDAYLDDCDECSDGNSGHDANSDIDCNGDCFGSFSTRKRNRRISRNPKTGKSILVQEKKHPYFRASKRLKEVLNN